MKNKCLIFITVLLIVLFLVSCQPAVTVPPTAAPTKTAQAYNPDDYTFDLPENDAYDFGGATFTIASYHAHYEQREDFARTYALIDQIQSRYNCTIKWAPAGQPELDTSALVGLPIADIASSIMSHQFVSLINAGVFSSLEPYKDKIKFDDARWEPSTKSLWRVNDVQYGLTPKIQELWKYHYVYCMFANKMLLENRGVDINELYAAQKKKEWNWSKFAEAANKITVDLNHDDLPDIYGCHALGIDWVTAFMVSAGTNVLKNDENGKLVFTFNQGVIDTLNFFTELIRTGGSRSLYDSASGVAYSGGSNDFINGKLGFYVDVFQRTWAWFTEMADPYGVLCIPMANNMTEYYLDDSMSRGNFIYNHQDKEFEAKVADLFYLYGTGLFSSPEDESACYWLEAENRIFDEGSRYFLDRVYERTNVIPTRNLEMLHNGLDLNFYDVMLGAKTPQEYLSEIAPVAQSAIDSYYNPFS
ncbi:MAG: extracellular solute-binding protein [Eubacteriales bacterium]|nr:extracellular solute-binding protein [Eubacteriales bacterium]